LWYTSRTTTAETKRINRIVLEIAQLARESLRKSNEIEAYLSIVEFRAGKAPVQVRGRPFPQTQVCMRDFHDRQI
jgi:hypothetical protein